MPRIEKLVERASLALLFIFQRRLKKRYVDYIGAGGFSPTLSTSPDVSQLARRWKKHNVQGDAKGYKYQNNLNSKNVNGESN